jgi:hypothetical protein
VQISGYDNTADNLDPGLRRVRAFLWFHGHAMNGSRYHVYAGLAGSYFMCDRGRRSWTCRPARSAARPCQCWPIATSRRPRLRHDRGHRAQPAFRRLVCNAPGPVSGSEPPPLQITDPAALHEIVEDAEGGIERQLPGAVAHEDTEMMRPFVITVTDWPTAWAAWRSR